MRKIILSAAFLFVYSYGASASISGMGTIAGNGGNSVVGFATGTVMVGFTQVFTVAGNVNPNTGFFNDVAYPASISGMARTGWIYGNNNTAANNMKFLIYDSTLGLQCQSSETSVDQTTKWWSFDLTACNYNIVASTTYFIGGISVDRFLPYGQGSSVGTIKDSGGSEATPNNPMNNTNGGIPSTNKSMYVTN